MRIRVDGGGYVTAATAFETGNQVAALVHDSLVGKLASYAGMAGHDESSVVFASAYDEAAGDAVGALSELVHAFASLGHLTTASLANHRDANVGSIIGGAQVYDGTALPADAYATVLAAAPPSSLGVAGTPALPYPLGLLVGALDGFVWPSAEVDRLRDAGHAWRSAAESVDNLTDYCRGAVRGLEGQESPEIPVAMDAIRALERTIDDLSDTYLSLAAACEEYAATVDAKRAELVALGHEVLRMIAEEAAISAGLGLLTGGVGAFLKGGAGLARIARYAPRFAAVLAALRAAAAATAGTIRTTHTAVQGLRVRLSRYIKASGQRSRRRGEAGEFDPWAFLPRWMRHHERAGGHAVRRHVGHSDEWLRERMASKPGMKLSSTFTDEATAERAISSVLRSHRQEVESWVLHGQGKLELDGRTPDAIGRVLSRQSGEIVDSNEVRVVLVPDDRLPGGWRMLTAFVRMPS